MSGNDSTLGRPLNDSSPLHNSSLEHRTGKILQLFFFWLIDLPIHVIAEEQPVSSTPLVLRGGRSSRRSSLRRSIFSRPSRDHSRDDNDPAVSGDPAISMTHSTSFHAPNRPIPRKLNDYFDSIASDSD